jgi:hypothetical protein
MMSNKKVRSLRECRKGNALALVLIIILIVGAILFFLFSESETGWCGVGFTVHYQDGTDYSFGISPNWQFWNQFRAMTIKVENKPVESIDIFVIAKFNEENIGAWSSEVSQQIEMYKKPSDESTNPEFSSTGHFTESGSSWESGTAKNLAVTSLDWQTIEEVVAGHGPASWHFQVNVEVDLEVNIGGEKQEFNALAPSGGFELVYSEGDGTPTMSMMTTKKPIA